MDENLDILDENCYPIVQVFRTCILFVISEIRYIKICYTKGLLCFEPLREHKDALWVLVKAPFSKLSTRCTQGDILRLQ